MSQLRQYAHLSTGLLRFEQVRLSEVVEEPGRKESRRNKRVMSNVFFQPFVGKDYADVRLFGNHDPDIS